MNIKIRFKYFNTIHTVFNADKKHEMFFKISVKQMKKITKLNSGKTLTKRFRPFLIVIIFWKLSSDGFSEHSPLKIFSVSVAIFFRWGASPISGLARILFSSSSISRKQVYNFSMSSKRRRYLKRLWFVTILPSSSSNGLVTLISSTFLGKFTLTACSLPREPSNWARNRHKYGIQ